MALIPLGGNSAGPKLLILHATGFHCQAYRPLAVALSHNFACFGLDFPGHGSAAKTSLALLDVHVIADYLTEAVDAAGLRGCLCLGHSAGGAFAIVAGARSPGLFAAIFSFEAVVSTPQTHAFMQRARDDGSINTSGQVLASAARNRRAVFTSKAEALAHLSRKQPFSSMHPDAVHLYVEHGCQCDVQQQQQQHPCVQLVCRPSVEASYYTALDPPPAVASSPGCPLMLAVAAMDTSSPAHFTTHDAVKAWLLQGRSQQQAAPTCTPASNMAHQPARPTQLHDVLAVLNAELAASLPMAQLKAVEGVSHFGPLEKPELIALLATEFFCRHHQQQQQECALQCVSASTPDSTRPSQRAGCKL